MCSFVNVNQRARCRCHNKLVISIMKLNLSAVVLYAVVTFSMKLPIVSISADTYVYVDSTCSG